MPTFTAFQSGVGDYYTGSLPIQSALLLDHPKDYVNVGGYEVLGVSKDKPAKLAKFRDGGAKPAPAAK